MTAAEKRALRAVADAVFAVTQCLPALPSAYEANLQLRVNAMRTAVAAVEHEDGSR